MKTIIHCLGELTGKNNLCEKKLIKKVLFMFVHVDLDFVAWNKIVVHKKCYSTSGMI